MIFYILMAFLTWGFVTARIPEDIPILKGFFIICMCSALWPLFWAPVFLEHLKGK